MAAAVLPYRDGQLDPFNCYGYALHVRAWIEPGTYYRGKSEVDSPSTLIKALESDGLEQVVSRAFNPEREHIIAAYLAEGVDYHFCRLDGTGDWSHKRGNGHPQSFDLAGNRIKVPEIANMHEYAFVGYFSVPADMRRLLIS